MSANSDAKPNFFGALGSRVLEFVSFTGGVAVLGVQSVKEMLTPPFYGWLTIEQMFLVGVRSFLLVAITALATGSVMTLQFSYGLEKFGGKLYVPRIVALSFIREMGPVFTSLLVAGRIGSGIAAEVASMKVTQQIDAIRALGTSPIKKIVIPRLLATIITLPILTMFANFIGLFGGMLVAMSEVGIAPEFFYQKCVDSIRGVDIVTGLLKAFIFAIFIALAACYRGMNSQGGTRGVGDTTTYVVVTTNIFIMVSDFFITKFFLLTMPYVQ